jgi:hypothetical protein
MSETGSDFESYRILYEQVGKNIPLSEIHGENLFLFLMRISNNLGLSYYAFRVVYLSAILGVFLNAVNKMTPNFALTFFMLMLGFIIYVVSAYRQFATMAFLLYAFYFLLYKRKALAAVLFAVVATLFHISGVIGLVFILAHCILRPNWVQTAKKYFTGSFMYLLIAVAFAFRLFIYFYGSRFFYSFVGAYPDTVILSFGVLSRLVVLVFVASQIRIFAKTNQDAKLTKKVCTLYGFYFISLLLYFAFPFELVMGRLTNNARILDIILIPHILHYFLAQRKQLPTKERSKTRRINFAAMSVVAVYGAMYIFQLLMQGGYSNYTHFLFK